MGVSLWIYLHRGEGQWERKSLAWFERFFAAKDRVLNPSGTRLELVEILIRHEERIPVEICHLNYFRMPILPDGSLDREREEERERTLFEAASDSYLCPALRRRHLWSSMRAAALRSVARTICGTGSPARPIWPRSRPSLAAECSGVEAVVGPRAGQHWGFRCHLRSTPGFRFPGDRCVLSEMKRISGSWPRCP